MRNFAATTENFSNSTQKISDSAQNLCTISDSLKKLQPEDANVAATETVTSEVE